MPQYAYTTPDRLNPPKWLPGTAPYAGEYDEFAREYANASGGTKATATLALTLAAGSAPGDGFNLYVKPDELSSAFQVPVTIPKTKPAAGAATQLMLAQAIADKATASGFGTFTPGATNVAFESLLVGQRITFYSDIDPAVGTLTASSTNGVPIGMGIAPGRIVYKDPSASYPSIDWENPARVAFLPTGPLTGTQQIAGVVMREREEVVPIALGFSGPVDYAEMNMPSLRVKETKHVVVELESPLVGAMPSQLYYRHTADGDNDQLGIGATAAGAGLAVLPKSHDVVEINGTAAVIRFH